MTTEAEVRLFHGDCLDVMRELAEAGVSVDAVITDPPYGTTACKWDSVIPFRQMWDRLNALIKPNGAIGLFGSEPFSSALRMSNINRYRYDWVWEKNRGSNFATVKYCPMKEHENISVFYRSRPTYNPIKELRSDGGKSRARYKINASNTGKREYCKNIQEIDSRYIDSDLRCPRSIQRFNTEVGLHPTQKPVALMEYLIKTYTNECETVLDFTMGSGTTGVACRKLNRKFIGIEQDEKYFKIAEERINQPVQKGML